MNGKGESFMGDSKLEARQRSLDLEVSRFAANLSQVVTLNSSSHRDVTRRDSCPSPKGEFSTAPLTDPFSQPQYDIAEVSFASEGGLITFANGRDPRPPQRRHALKLQSSTRLCSADGPCVLVTNLGAMVGVPSFQVAISYMDGEVKMEEDEEEGERVY